MRSVQEIKSSINGLPKEDFWILAEWCDREKNHSGDEHMQTDAEAGISCLRKPPQLARSAGKAFSDFKRPLY